MDPGLVLERTKRSKKRLFSAMLRYFSRNLSGSHQNNALSCEKTPRFLYIPLFIQQALHYYKIVATNTAFLYISPKSAEETAVFDFVHRIVHDFFDRCNANGNPFL